MRSSFVLFAMPVVLAFLIGSKSTLRPQHATPPHLDLTNPARKITEPEQSQPVAFEPGKAPPFIPLALHSEQPVFAVIPGAPAAKNVEAESIPVELEEILQQWELASSKFKSLQGMHTRTVYDLALEVEKVSSGKFYLAPPDQGRIDFVGLKPKLGQQSSTRISKEGKPFQLVADSSQKWICTGKEIVMTDDAAKTFRVFPLPKAVQEKIESHNPLPFLIRMNAVQAKQRFRITLQSNSHDRAVLIFKPRQESDLMNYTQAYIILDTKSYLPTAVKLFDPSGNMETVYKFESVRINNGNSPNGMFSGDTDLKGQGYTQVFPKLW